MASTYSTNLKIELIGTGEQSGTWGTTTNTNLGTLIEQAIAGYVTQAVTDGAATVLTIPDGASSNGRNYVIELTGTLTAARTVEVPAVDKPYIFFNNTTGGYSVTVKVTGQTGVTIANGKKAIVYTNSTDVIEVVNAPVSEAGTQTLSNKTLSSPTVTGVATFAAGTVSAPAITTTGDTNTGIFFPAADTIAFTEGGVESMRIDSSGNVSVASGNLTFSATGQRITGDFTNATLTNRLMFQNSVANGASNVQALPNGTGTTAGFLAFANSDPTNTNFAQIAAIGPGTETRINSGITGSGTYAPMTFYTGGSERMRVDTSGNVGIGTSSPGGYKLNVSGTALVTSSIVTNSDLQVNPSGYNLYLRNIGGTNRIDSYNSPITATVPLQLNASQMTFQIADAEKMRIDSSGNVGVGTSSPVQKFHVSGSGSTYTRVSSSNAGSGAGSYFANATSTWLIGAGPASGGSEFAFVDQTSGSLERMRIDSSGNLLVGTTSNNGVVTSFTSSNTGRAGFFMVNAASSLAADALGVSKFDNDTTTSQVFVKFFINNNAAASGLITANGANQAAFTSSSDSRLKENIAPLPSQLEKICALKPSEFDYKDGTGHQIGFIAQEMQEVYPDCVGEDANGMLLVSGWSKTEACLVSAIQELKAQNDELKARVAALENA